MNKFYNEKLTYFIKNAMDKQNKNENQFAKDCGINQPTLHRILSGENKLSIEIADKIANYLNCSIDELIGRNKEDNSYSYTETIYQDNETNFKHIRKK